MRVWRTILEGLQPVISTIRHRWKGASEMVFRGCYSYDYKGPCHCWKQETVQEKKAANQAFVKLCTSSED